MILILIDAYWGVQEIGEIVWCAPQVPSGTALLEGKKNRGWMRHPTVAHLCNGGIAEYDLNRTKALNRRNIETSGKVATKTN
jgi:hypothetical protein